MYVVAEHLAWSGDECLFVLGCWALLRAAWTTSWVSMVLSGSWDTSSCIVCWMMIGNSPSVDGTNVSMRLRLSQWMISLLWSRTWSLSWLDRSCLLTAWSLHMVLTVRWHILRLLGGSLRGRHSWWSWSCWLGHVVVLVVCICVRRASLVILILVWVLHNLVIAWRVSSSVQLLLISQLLLLAWKMLLWLLVWSVMWVIDVVLNFFAQGWSGIGHLGAVNVGWRWTEVAIWSCFLGKHVRLRMVLDHTLISWLGEAHVGA